MLGAVTRRNSNSPLPRFVRSPELRLITRFSTTKKNSRHTAIRSAKFRSKSRPFYFKRSY